MYYADNEKRKMANDRGNRTTKSRKYHNAWRKGNLMLRNVGSEYHQTCKDERKN